MTFRSWRWETAVSFPTVSYLDPEGNLYLGDFDWQRVLVYKQPLARFTPPNPQRPRRPAPDRTPTPHQRRPQPHADEYADGIGHANLDQARRTIGA